MKYGSPSKRRLNHLLSDRPPPKRVKNQIDPRQASQQGFRTLGAWKEKKIKTIPAFVKPEKKATGRGRGRGERASGKKKVQQKYRGVSWDADHGKWQATLLYKRKKYDLGLFEYDSTAAQHVDRKYVEVAGDFVDQSRLNFKGKLHEYTLYVKKQRRLAEERRRAEVERQKQEALREAERKRREEEEERRQERLTRLGATLKPKRREAFIGVFKNKGKFEAELRFQGHTYRSTHSSEFQAAVARDQMVVQYCGPHTSDPRVLAQKLNFPERLTTSSARKSVPRRFRPSQHNLPLPVGGPVLPRSEVRSRPPTSVGNPLLRAKKLKRPSPVFSNADLGLHPSFMKPTFVKPTFDHSARLPV